MIVLTKDTDKWPPDTLSAWEVQEAHLVYKKGIQFKTVDGFIVWALFNENESIDKDEYLDYVGQMKTGILDLTQAPVHISFIP